ncbi:hypothetical protein [Streptomyces sp. NPDC000880]
MPLPLPLATMCDLACEPSLLPRIRMGIAVIAREVFMESPDTPGYPLRVNLARSAASPSEDMAALMTPGMVASPDVLQAAAAVGSTDAATIAAALSDDLILDAIRQGWGVVAGVLPTTPVPGGA